MTNPRDFYPFPNWFDPRGDQAPVYEVRDSNLMDERTVGSTDKERGVMAIPFDKYGRGVARHEMGHVMWSPVRVPKASKKRDFPSAERECYIVLEEARVNMGLAELGCPFEMEKAGKHSADFVKVLKEADGSAPAKSILLAAIATMGTDCERLAENGVVLLNDPMERMLTADILRDAKVRIDKAFAATKKVVPSTRVMRKIAKWMALRLELAHQEMIFERDRFRESKGRSKTYGQERKLGSGFAGQWGDWGDMERHPMVKALIRRRPPVFGKPLPQEDPSLAVSPVTPAEAAGLAMKPSSAFVAANGWVDAQTYRDPIGYIMNGFTKPIESDIKPGSMTIEEPPMPESCEEIRNHRKRAYTAAEEGTQLGDVHRIITDRRVFKRKAKVRRGGGTVLFDLSGSMGELSEAIDDVISTNPTATTCATYSGTGGSGVLRVVVRSGRRVEAYKMSPPDGHGNVVDLPAVDWLSRQPAPRVWVTDEGVTGVEDHGSEELQEACYKICDAFNISILSTPYKVAKHLKGWKEGDKARQPTRRNRP